MQKKHQNGAGQGKARRRCRGTAAPTVRGGKPAKIAPDPLGRNVVRPLLQSAEEALVGVLVEDVSDRFGTDLVAGETAGAVVAGELAGETVRMRVLAEILHLEVGKGAVDHAVIGRSARVVVPVAAEAG